jgi:hexokinase
MNKLFNTLPHMASHEYQRRYIEHPTADKYVLPAELLEDVQNAVEVALQSQDFLASATKSQRKCLQRLLELVKDKSLDLDFDASDVINSLVDHNASWVAVRNQAKLCLEALQFDLTKWEAEKLASDHR